MIAYPILTDALGFESVITGVFLGATIHDVAQVVGARFSISEETGEVATVVKLIRVAMLAPVILIASLIIRRHSTQSDISEKPVIIPVFVVVFVILVGINSFGFIPVSVLAISTEISRWALLLAIAAVGLKTCLKDVVDVGPSAIALLFAKNAFLGVWTLFGLYWISPF